MGTPKTKQILTTAQALELKWFCQNVAGTRTEFYKVIEPITGFDHRLKRLEKTCELIEKFLGEKIEPTDFSGRQTPTEREVE